MPLPFITPEGIGSRKLPSEGLAGEAVGVLRLLPDSGFPACFVIHS